MIVDENRYESKYYIVNMETGEKTEWNGIKDIQLEPLAEVDDGELFLKLPELKTSIEFTCTIRYPDFKTYKRIFGMPMLNKKMFPTYNNGFPVVSVVWNGETCSFRGWRAIRFIRQWNKMARKYNSGLHDNFIRVNTQEKVIKRC